MNLVLSIKPLLARVIGVAALLLVKQRLRVKLLSYKIAKMFMLENCKRSGSSPRTKEIIDP